MIQGHTLQVLLAPEYQGGQISNAWLFRSGALTSCTFLMLSGLSFSVATSLHWSDYLRPTSRLWKRFRRYFVLLVLGYAMHLPVRALVPVRVQATAQEWQSFAHRGHPAARPGGDAEPAAGDGMARRDAPPVRRSRPLSASARSSPC